MKRTRMIGLFVVLVVFAAIVVAGCGVNSGVGDGGTVSTTEAISTTTVTLQPQETTTTVETETTTTTAPPVEKTLTLNVYYSRGEKICAAARVVPATKEVGAAAMKALLEGPTVEEKGAGTVSNIPEGTTFLDLTIENGIATVDLSKEYESGGGSLSMAMRLAEVVFTLTQFDTVKGVNFKLDGQPVEVFSGEGIILDHPVNRSDYEDLSPAILVESPTLGQEVGSSFRIRGTANVFEALFQVEILDASGNVLADEKVTATAGTGTRGDFDVTIPLDITESGSGRLVVFSNSPKDGSKINEVETPLVLKR
ncbi:MAG: GerMN domain-containing protein [Actinobacteria bacterium]|nr:GerMN domain-containing protein [Actinomycetota bacterium]